jgi:hypothetical protein
MADDVGEAQPRDAAPQCGRVCCEWIAKIESRLRDGVDGAGSDRGARGHGVSAGEIRQHDDRRGCRRHNLLDGIEARHPGKLDVHRHEIGLQPRQLGHRLLCVREDADDVDRAVVLEHSAQGRYIRSRVVTENDSSAVRFHARNVGLTGRNFV